MPLRKINRLISLNALKEFDLTKDEILSELFRLNKKNKINTDDLGYIIGPILNSGGRLGKSNYATELLSSNKLDIIKQRSLELVNLNNERKKLSQ